MDEPEDKSIVINGRPVLIVGGMSAANLTMTILYLEKRGHIVQLINASELIPEDAILRYEKPDIFNIENEIREIELASKPMFAALPPKEKPYGTKADWRKQMKFGKGKFK